MAAGAAPAPVKAGKNNETAESVQVTPQTFKQRVQQLLHDIFAGREEYAGWRQ